MAYPILAEKDTWYKGKTTVPRSTITEIEIKASYPNAPADAWDASAAGNGSVKACIEGTKLTIFGTNGEAKIALSPDCSALFSDMGFADYFSNVTSISGLKLLDSSGVTAMTAAFYEMTSVQSIDIGKNSPEDTDFWDLTSCERAANMFAGCRTATEINVDGISLPVCTKANNMFEGCAEVTELKTGVFGFGAVEKLEKTFSNCKKLQTADVASWDIGKCTTINEIFEGCAALQNPDVSNWDLHSCTDTSKAFFGCQAITSELAVDNWDMSHVTTVNSMFSADGEDGYAPGLTTIHCENWDVHNVTDMGWFCYGQSALAQDGLRLGRWDVGNVTSFARFACWSYAKLYGLENWEPKKCVNFDGAFESCDFENHTLDVTKWAERAPGCDFISFGRMFRFSPIEHIKGLHLLDTSKCKSFLYMFEGSNMKELDCSNLDTTSADDTWVDVDCNNNPGGVDRMLGEYTVGSEANYLKYLKKINIGPNFKFNGNGACTPLQFPVPMSAYLPEADGNWYKSDGTAVAPAAVPEGNGTDAVTYYAASAFVPDPNDDLLTKRSSLDGIADVIRTKGGTTADLNYPEGFKAAISAISGAKPEEQGEYTFTENVESKLIEPTPGSVFSSFLAHVNVSGGGGSDDNNAFDFIPSMENVFQGVAFPADSEITLKTTKGNITNAKLAFKNATGVKKITWKLIADSVDMSSAFSYAADVQTVDFTGSNFKISRAASMFEYANSIVSVLGNETGALDMSDVTGTGALKMFNNCALLESITFVPGTIKCNMYLYPCNALSAASVQSVIDGLAVTEETKSIQFGLAIKPRLTDAQKAQIAATNTTLA